MILEHLHFYLYQSTANYHDVSCPLAGGLKTWNVLWKWESFSPRWRKVDSEDDGEQSLEDDETAEYKCADLLNEEHWKNGCVELPRRRRVTEVLEKRNVHHNEKNWNGKHCGKP